MDKKHLLSSIDAISDWSRRISQLLLIPMVGLTVLEVILRYFFNSPTVWLWPITTMLFGCFVIMTGAYTLSKNEHIRIDIVWGQFSPRGKAIANIFTSILFFSYAITLLIYGWDFAFSSIRALEMDLGGIVAVPLWPTKTILLIAIVILLLQGVANLFRDLSSIFFRRGK